MSITPRSLAVWEAFFRNASAGPAATLPVPDEELGASACLCHMLEPGQVAFDRFVDSSHLFEGEQPLSAASTAPPGCPGAVGGHALALRSKSSLAEVAAWSGQSERARVVSMAADSGWTASQWTDLVFRGVSEWGGGQALGRDFQLTGKPLTDAGRTPRQLKLLTSRYAPTSTSREP